MRLFHLEVLVASGNTENPFEFRPMRPSGTHAQPYEFTEDEARKWMGVYVNQSGKPDHYRIVEIE